MFTKKPSPELDGLKELIGTLRTRMTAVPCDSKEYAQMADQLSKLYAMLKEIDPPSKKVSADTLALIAANLVGIILIIGHEHVNVITSKALGFVMKAK